MDIQQLRYILALNEEKNFNRAALKVGITQPTLSHQIKKLEDELGSPLFERLPRTVALTQAGATFMPYVQSALDTLQSGVTLLKQDKALLRGKIKLAFIPTVGPYIMPRVLKELKKAAPEIQLILYEETTSSLLENLKRKKFDMGLLALPIDDATLVNKKLVQEPFLLAVPAHDPLSRKKEITLKDIQDRSLIMLKEGHCFRDQALDFCQRNASNMQVSFEGSSLLSVLNLVASGQGITFIPQMAIPSHRHKNLKFIPFKEPAPTRQLGLIWRMSTPMTHLERALIKSFEQSLLKI